MLLAAVDQLGVHPDRDVVQKEPLARAPHVDPALRSRVGVERTDRIVAVEPEVACEVVARAERDADEREVALDRNVCDRRERPVAAGRAQGAVRGRPSELRGVVVRPQDVRVDPAAARLLAELFRARAVVARARVDQELTYASTGSRPSDRSSADFGWAPIAAAAGSPSLKSTIAGIDAIP